MFCGNLVHGNGTSKHSRPLIGYIEKIQKTLNRTVLAIRPVEDDEGSINPMGIGHEASQICFGIIVHNVVFVLVQGFVNLFSAVDGNFSFG